ncbi:MAG: NADH-quinone oxidoreductase subunit J [Armatimonadota bacterium]|nr:NADH-quinone oxidoreductase subunit J [Armatimonadota bacterium]MDR7439913.1 NADH-quinone oxidoreductase subunit J [Armatimonadota bacterium]MDR7562516.1 NADH-quinone oxidoreductase subunit J [Armatimonadota bacterium]MDR7566785.1 NADH-quinone oxidoreductase subunit J [Armatimonadota bacterium]MDR7601400.1 NADH-quinone oxidoreductase subunit J [Armatimonadota bacterium]
MAEAVAFYGLTAVALGASLMVVLSRNMVHAAVSLIPVLLAIAGYYVLLGAEFLAAIQILIYAGAITVLILFVILLTEGATGLRVRPRNEQVPLGAITCLVLAALLIAVLTRTPWPQTRSSLPEYNPGAVGESFLTAYVLPFEAMSLLIVACLVGAIVVARREE